MKAWAELAKPVLPLC